MQKNFPKLGVATIVATFTAITLFAFSAKTSSDEPVESSYNIPMNMCPPNNCTVLLPNPADCSTFFSCSNGVPILMNCPDGLHFNDQLDVCDWPQYAGCSQGY